MNAELLAQNIAAHWVQSGVLAVVVLVAMRLSRPMEPRFNLAAMHLTLVAILLLPLVQPRQPVAASVAPVTVAVSFADGPTRYSRVDPEPAPSARLDVGSAVLAFIAAGIVLRLIWLCGGMVRLRRLRKRGREIVAPEVARDFESDLGVTPRYYEHREYTGPATFGISSAIVMLPQKFGFLDVATQRAIVCHELVHVKRRDVAVAVLEEFVVAFLWFHPWVWLLRSRIRSAREQVVDRQVIELIGNREMYVKCLVELSGHDLVPHLSAGMLTGRELRMRIDGLLQESTMSRRRVVALGLMLSLVAAATGSLAAWAVPLRGSSTSDRSDSTGTAVSASLFSRAPAAGPGFGMPPAGLPFRTSTKFFNVIVPEPQQVPAQSQQTSMSTAPRQLTTPYADYPQDALEKRISGTVVVDVVVNPAGEVTTGAVVSGPQELRASAFKAALGLKFESGSGTAPMRVLVEYRLTADSWGVRVSSADPRTQDSSDQMIRRPIGLLERKAPQTEVAAHDTPLTGLRIGGAVKPPTKVKHVPLVYPASAQEAGVQGVVIVEVRIDETGNVNETRILRSIPLLDQAALDAVRQWQYTPTLLNGAAVPVVMTITVNFSLRTQVQMRITMPDGALTLVRTSPNGGIARTEYAPMSKYGFAPFVDPDRSASTVKVVIYELSEPGTAPTMLGAVELEPGGGPVQTATTPSFGIELISVDR